MNNNLFISIVAILYLIPLLTMAKEPVEIDWDQLMPPGYLESLLDNGQPKSSIQSPDIFEWDDSSIEAQSAFEELKIKLSSAPIVPELDNQYIKLAGFVVPLDFDFDHGTFSEFLLVPYHGACIHVPPPPSNQIVHVSSKKPVKEEWLNYAVWVSGVLTTKSVDSEYGYAGYSMKDVSIEEYEE